MTPEEARDFRNRWKRVNAAERDELRRMSPTEKFRRLVALMASAGALGSDRLRESEEAEARRRWQLLREKIVG